ncbi:unnamed protein product [Lupinus luteus]|uniref:HECT-type E3 ubiquitin transferase n=1 Tax=Lupinus luteus TaxID=3873 RepID=A0AAV1XT72_LUPLU
MKLKRKRTLEVRTVGKYSIRDTSLNSKLFAFAQGFGGKEEGLGLIASAAPNACDPLAYELGYTLHFEFYAANKSECDIKVSEPLVQGLQIIHLCDINKCVETDLELLRKLVTEYKLPAGLRFSLLTRLRFTRAFGSLASRQQYTCIRLYAFTVFIQACSDANDLVSFLNAEPGFINELVSLLSYEDAVMDKIRILCLHSLAALCQDRSHQTSVLTGVTSGGHRGILSSLMQKAIDCVVSGDNSRWSVHFAEALLSLVTVLVSSSSSSGRSAMCEAGFIPTLLPLLKDTNPQHLHLVEKAVHILEAFMEYSNQAVALFRDWGGLDDTISRLYIEVSHVESGGKHPDENSESCARNVHMKEGSSTGLNGMQPLYSEPLIAYHRRLLMKALLRAISLGTYARESIAHIYGYEENVLPYCLCIIFRRAKDFGGGVFSLAATVMRDLIQKDPTCFPVLDTAGLPSAFLDAIMDDVLNSAEAITCIPQCLDALCLNSNGLQAVKDKNSLRCFVKVFTSRTYLRTLTGDTPASLSSGLDELMRHASSLRGPGVDMLVEILETISKIGSRTDSPSLPCSSISVPMEMDGEDNNLMLPDNRESSKADSAEQIIEPSDASVMNIESFLPDCANNVARLLETILHNADTCRIFVEKKGIEAVLQLFTLPLMPPIVSLGQNIFVAFKNFSPQHNVSLVRTLCSFLREHLKSTNEFLDLVGGTQIALVESAKQTKVLKYLSSLEGLLSLSASLLKGAAITVVSELSTSDASVLKDIGRSYKEIIWKISLCNDSMAEENNTDQEPEMSQVPSPDTVERESDDDGNVQTMRYTNSVFAGSGSHSMWSGERDFVSVVRYGESLHRRSRHGLSRLRGGWTGSHLEALNINSEPSSSLVEVSLSHNLIKKSPDVLALEILNKLASTMRSFFNALVKRFTSPNRRRPDPGPPSSASKTLRIVLATSFLEALSFYGHYTYAGLEMSLSVKCRYLGKIVDDMAALIFDSRRRSCYTAMVNNFYVNGTFKEILTTFEATSQLLWTLPCTFPSADIDIGKKGDGSKLSNNIWLLDTLQSYCRLLEYFVNSSLLLSPISTSQAELLIQPIAVGLSIGLFPLPRDPDAFIRMLQSQVVDVILPVWNHPMFSNCSPGFISSIISLVTHVYSGVGDVKQNHGNIVGGANQNFMPPPPDETTIATIVEMGFSRARAEEALRRVETNSVEMAMEWLFSHADDPVQEDDELTRALALSLGNSSESTKVDSDDKTIDVLNEEGHVKKPPVDDILVACVKLFQGSGSVVFQLTDFFVTLCSQNKGEGRPKVISYLLQQLKLCPLDFSKDNCQLSVLAHIIALLLCEDESTREIAVENGIISTTIDILTNFKGTHDSEKELLAPKCISALLLILDQMLQSRAKTESTGGMQTSFIPNSSGDHGSLQFAGAVVHRGDKIDGNEKEPGVALENILGKSTGFASIDESHMFLNIACDLIKQHVPTVVMQAVLQLCGQLTKTHALALQFLENGDLDALFGLPKNCFFPGYDTVVSAVQAQSVQPPAYAPPSAEEIDPEFLAALPPDIEAEVLAQQRAQRVAQLAEGQPIDMDNASIIATFPADLREELSGLPSPLLAEAQILRDRAMSHYQARSSYFGSSHRLNNRRNGSWFDRRQLMDRGVGVTLGRRSALTDSLKLKEIEGEPLLDANALKALIRLLRLAQPLGKGLLQRLLLNLCAHSVTRATLVYFLLDMIKPEAEGSVCRLATLTSQRLYGCQSNTVYGQSQLLDGLPPLVFRRILEILYHLVKNHSAVAKMMFHFDQSVIPDCSRSFMVHMMNEKGKEKVIEGESAAHLEQVMGLIQVAVDNAASELESQSQSAKEMVNTQDLVVNEASDKIYMLAGNVLKTMASIVPSRWTFFTIELSESAHALTDSAIGELVTLQKTNMLGLSAGSMAGAVILRVLQALSSLTSLNTPSDIDMGNDVNQNEDQATIWNPNAALEPLWQELSNCISAAEMQLDQSSFSPTMPNINVAENLQGVSTSPPFPPGTQRLLPFIEAFFVLCEKLQANESIMHQDNGNATAREVKESAGCLASMSVKFGGDSQRRFDDTVTFTRFAEKHRRLSNAFIRQSPGLLEKSLSMLLKAPRLIDFDNKRAYFRSRIRQQHDQHLSGPLQISVRRAYILEDSYNQLRMRPNQELNGRLNVQFQGEEGIDAGGLTREWYQLLSRVIFDKGALLFTNVGNNATFQPNPNSVYQTEHLSYFKFVGRVVGKALFDGQLLDVYFTRSFYKHILGVKNDVSDIPDLTFSMDPDEEKHILYEKNEVNKQIKDYMSSVKYSLPKLGNRSLTMSLNLEGGTSGLQKKQSIEYVDLVAEHMLTNAIRPQINSFLEGVNELVPGELISIFNDKELELLISGLPEIDFDDLKANTEYTGYTLASSVVQWFWEVVKSFNKEDMARFLQFVTGTSKVPLEGFKALQGISGPQRFQIDKAYGAPDRLPSAHTCFNQLDLPEYTSKEQLQERLLLAIHEASEGFGFG